MLQSAKAFTRLMALLLALCLLAALMPLGAGAWEEQPTGDYWRFYVTLHTNMPDGTDEALSLGNVPIYNAAALNFPASDYITSPYKWTHADGSSAKLNQVITVGGKKYFLINYTTAANPGPNDRTLEYTDIISKVASTDSGKPTELWCQWVELKEPYVLFFLPNADEGIPLYEVYTGVTGEFTVPNHHYYSWDDGSGRKTYVAAYIPEEIYVSGDYALEDGWLPGEKVTVTKNMVMRPRYGDWYVNLHFLNKKDQATVWNYYPVLKDSQAEWGDWERRSAYSGIARETFLGWSAGIDGSGTLYTIQNSVKELIDADIHDLYAVYSDTQTYAINLEKPAHGALTCERESAMYGAEVFVTALPDEGYGYISYDEFQNVSVVDADGKEVGITIANQTKYPHQFYFTMPDKAVTVRVAFPVDPDNSPTVFTDVPSDAYYADAVAWAVDSKVTTGTSATTFTPAGNVTRGQAVTFLWRAEGEPEPTTTSNPFTDVKVSDYYYKAVLWAVENGITNGTSKTTFSPKGSVTRGQMMTFLYRTLGEPGKTGDGAWYADAERWANGAALLDGTAVAYSTNGDCPRSDVVYYLWKALA